MTESYIEPIEKLGISSKSIQLLKSVGIGTMFDFTIEMRKLPK